MADRLNRRWVIVGSLGVWSGITWLTGHAQTFEQLWWARALMGVSEACYIPAGIALIADYHDGGTRSRAIGIPQSGIYTGMILGGMGGFIADSSYRWRAGFQWFGAAGVIYAVVLMVFLRNRQRGVESVAASTSVPSSLKELLSLGDFLFARALLHPARHARLDCEEMDVSHPVGHTCLPRWRTPRRIHR